ncbi:hypothetical protein FACS1894159_02770 [Bacteroidia bacterium]|nr:hypothetical protein FACS1894159_02770 [Bacteroidia bacterium]
MTGLCAYLYSLRVRRSDPVDMLRVAFGKAARMAGVHRERIDRFDRETMRRKVERFDRRWVRRDQNGESYYDFRGALLPFDPMYKMYKVFIDSLAIWCHNGDRYSPRLVRAMDARWEGAYGYTGDGIDVVVRPGDTVIDAGSWIGDFAAYVSARGATAYAFEPTPGLYDMLCRTAKMNAEKNRPGSIVPVRKGLGDRNATVNFSVCDPKSNGEGNSFLPREGRDTIAVETTTIDDFVRERGLSRVDFIKADIEGYERNMLAGARDTLRRFAPRLALCTYHLPDDPQRLRELILEANPRYRIVQLGKKLFAEAEV